MNPQQRVKSTHLILSSIMLQFLHFNLEPVLYKATMRHNACGVFFYD